MSMTSATVATEPSSEPVPADERTVDGGAVRGRTADEELVDEGAIAISRAL